MARRKDLIRKLYYSDNLPILQEMEDESINLIYLDPPFNSNRAYNIIYPGDLGQVTAFEDTWYWTPECDVHLQTMKHLNCRRILNALVDALGKIQVCAYLVNMAVRLIEIRRVLNSTGTVYLHCDPTASHYLKIVMDAIFGQNNFRNEIVWCYRGGGVPKNDFARKHDIILRYSKGKTVCFNVDEVRIPYSEDSNERLHYTARAFRPGRVYDNYEQNPLGKHPEDWWEIQPVMPSSKERLSYPTQKPLKLLERILKASSNEGDLVFDPFCGCGTTIAAAEKLGRNWIGIDITYSAIAAIKERFKRQKLNIWGEIQILGEPESEEDVETNLLRSESARSRKEFEKFCVTTIGGLPNSKMGADGGIDGRIPLPNNEIAVISVKSGKVNVTQVRELKGLLNGKNKVGIFVTKEKPTQPMIQFANQAGIYQYSKESILRFEKQQPIPIIQILTLDEVVKGIKPILPQ